MHEELRIGLDFAAPIPLHTDFSSGTFEGFEVDLMKLVGEKLDLKLTYEVSLWKDILQKLREGRIDVICSAVTVTPERRLFVDFSEPYLSFRLCVVTNKENKINSTDHLTAQHVGVRKATEAEKFIKTYLQESKVIFSDTNEELYQLLKDRKIDLLIDDSPIAGGFLKLNNNLKVSLFLPGTESFYAIAIKKGNVQIRNSINTILSEIKKDGCWQKFYDKWFEDIIL